jgi:hypothetical protein
MFNERVWHPEEAVYRAVTGESSNFPNGDGTFTIGTFPTKGTIPKAVTKTGTFKSTGANVRGSGTLFTKQCRVGDYLYNNDAEVRRIKEVISDDMLILDSAFGADISSATAVKVCEKQYFVAVYAKSIGTANAELQETVFAVSETFFSGGAPIAYDASATDAQIAFECHK